MTHVEIAAVNGQIMSWRAICGSQRLHNQSIKQGTRDRRTYTQCREQAQVSNMDARHHHQNQQSIETGSAERGSKMENTSISSYVPSHERRQLHDV
jgi:hypothetical protein